MSNLDRFQSFAATEGVREDLKAKSVLGGFSTAASGMIDLVLRLGSTVLLARLVIPEHWGLVGIVAAFTAIADQFRDFGLSAATLQKKEITHQQVSNLFWINTLGGVLIAVVISAFAPLISAFYDDHRLTPITIAIATNFIWAGLAVQHSALLSRQMKLTHLAAIRLGANLLSIVLAIILAFNGFGYWALVWREVARNIFLAAGAAWACPWVPGLPRRKTEMGGLLGYGRDIALIQILGAAISNVDRILIGKFFGPVPVGMYRQAHQLIMAPLEQLLGPVNAVARPGLCALQSDRARFKRYYEKIVFVVGLVTMPLGLFVAVYSKELTFLLLGEKWLDAAVFLAIFGVTLSIRPAGSTAFTVAMSTGNSQRFIKVILLHNLVFIVFIIIGLRWGAAGVAVADGARTAVLLLPTLYLSFKNTPATIGGFFHALQCPIAASLFMTAILIVFRMAVPVENFALSLALGGTVAFLSYLGAWMAVPAGRTLLKELLSDLEGPVRRLVFARNRNTSETSSSS